MPAGISQSTANLPHLSVRRWRLCPNRSPNRCSAAAEPAAAAAARAAAASVSTREAARRCRPEDRSPLLPRHVTQLLLPVCGATGWGTRGRRAIWGRSPGRGGRHQRTGPEIERTLVTLRKTWARASTSEQDLNCRRVRFSYTVKFRPKFQIE